MKKTFKEKAKEFISRQVNSEGDKAITSDEEAWIENFAQTLDDEAKDDETQNK